MARPSPKIRHQIKNTMQELAFLTDLTTLLDYTDKKSYGGAWFQNIQERVSGRSEKILSLFEIQHLLTTKYIFSIRSANPAYGNSVNVYRDMRSEVFRNLIVKVGFQLKLENLEVATNSRDYFDFESRMYKSTWSRHFQMTAECVILSKQLLRELWITLNEEIWFAGCKDPPF